jgi:AcrR family transcriptional regulator
MPVAQIDRATRRKTESRQRLLAAARELFVERGYHATRPQDIARAADVGHGTFYLYFADKRDCFLAFAEEACLELEGFIREQLARVSGVEAQIRTLLTALIDYAERHPGVLRTAMTDLSVIAADEAPADSLVDRWARGFAADLAAGAARGAVYGDYDAGVIGHAIVGLIRGATRHGAKRATRAALIDNLTRFMVRALVPEGAADPHQRLFLWRDATP